MQIHGLVFIIVGIIIGLVSYFTNMYIFYVAAAGFILWGLYKIVKSILSRKFLGANSIKITQPKLNELKINEYESGKDISTDETVHCPKCGLKHYAHANYCQKCGTKLK